MILITSELHRTICQDMLLALGLSLMLSLVGLDCMATTVPMPHTVKPVTDYVHRILLAKIISGMHVQ